MHLWLGINAIYTNKTVWSARVARFSQQNYPIAFLCIPPVQIVFLAGFPGKMRIPGAKYHNIAVASTRGHEKQPAATVLKYPNSAGKLQTWQHRGVRQRGGIQPRT